MTAGQGKIAIDFGCGSEPYRSIFESKGTIYRGADFTDADILISDDGRVDARSASFDLVLSFQVLEHVRNVGNYLSEAHRLLLEPGFIILTLKIIVDGRGTASSWKWRITASRQ
ncbi:MAG: methyltransferase domain-containing protein [Methylocella sp.]